MRIEPSRRRLELQHRPPRHLVEAEISELGPVGTNDMRRAGAAALTLHAANLEQVAKIGAEQEIDAQAAAAAIVVANAEALVADALPQEFGALEKDGVARELAASVQLDVGVGEIDGESRLVLVDDRAQEERPLAVQPELQMRQVAGVAIEKPFRGVLDRADVAIAVEHGEGIAVLQVAERPLDQRRLRLDLMIKAGLVVLCLTRRRDEVESAFDHCFVLRLKRGPALVVDVMEIKPYAENACAAASRRRREA